MAEGGLDGMNVSLQNKHSGLFLDARSNWNISQRKNHDGEPQQKFTLIHKEKNIYFIKSAKNGKAFDLAESRDEDGGEVISYPFHGGVNQRWCFEETRQGSWIITSAWGAKRALTVPGNFADDDQSTILTNKIFTPESKH